MPCVQPRRKATDGVPVAKTSTSTSGRFDAIISVALPNRVRRFEPGLAERRTDERVTEVVHPPRSASIAAGACSAEDARFEHQDAGARPPGVARQSGFDARVLEKRLAIPSVFRRDLRQQQPARRASARRSGHAVRSRSRRSTRSDARASAGKFPSAGTAARPATRAESADRNPRPRRRDATSVPPSGESDVETAETSAQIVAASESTRTRRTAAQAVRRRRPAEARSPATRASSACRAMRAAALSIDLVNHPSPRVSELTDPEPLPDRRRHVADDRRLVAADVTESAYLNTRARVAPSRLAACSTATIGPPPHA